MAEAINPTHTRNLNNVGANISRGVCTITSLVLVNTSGAAVFIQVYDAAIADVVVGTTRPLFSIPVGSTTGIKQITFNRPMLFNKRFSAAATTTAEGAGDPGAGVFLQAWIH